MSEVVIRYKREPFRLLQTWHRNVRILILCLSERTCPLLLNADSLSLLDASFSITLNCFYVKRFSPKDRLVFNERHALFMNDFDKLVSTDYFQLKFSKLQTRLIENYYKGITELIRNLRLL